MRPIHLNNRKHNIWIDNMACCRYPTIYCAFFSLFYGETLNYDDFDSLRERLIECIPDFRLRLKLDPKSEQVVFAADVSSVFDIAWYTFARLLTEDPSLECLGSDGKRHGGIMICCHHCGQFFYRKAKHQQYCDRPECQKARNAKNQRVFRKRKSNEKSRKEKKRELGE